MVTRAAQFMELSMKKDERAYTPSGNSLGLLHSLLPVSLSAVPDCIAYISSFHAVHRRPVHS